MCATAVEKSSSEHDSARQEAPGTEHSGLGRESQEHRFVPRLDTMIEEAIGMSLRDSLSERESLSGRTLHPGPSGARFASPASFTTIGSPLKKCL